MRFQTAKKLSYEIHRLILVIIFFCPMIYIDNHYPAFTRLYIILFFVGWFLSLHMFNGCIFTHTENIISRKLYGRDFYPNYGFNKSYGRHVNLLKNESKNT